MVMVQWCNGFVFYFSVNSNNRYDKISEVEDVWLSEFYRLI